MKYLAIGVLLLLAACKPAPTQSPEIPGDVDAAIHELFDPIGQYDCFRSIAWRESRYSPSAVGGGQYLGLFQIRGQAECGPTSLPTRAGLLTRLTRVTTLSLPVPCLMSAVFLLGEGANGYSWLNSDSSCLFCNSVLLAEQGISGEV